MVGGEVVVGAVSSRGWAGGDDNSIGTELLVAATVFETWIMDDHVH